MKNYEKPEVNYVDFALERITNDDFIESIDDNTGVVSGATSPTRPN